MSKRAYKKKKSYGSYARKGAQSVATVAKLARDVMYLKSLINVEFKYIDLSAAATAISTTATISNVNGIGTGTSAITRTGQSILMKSVLFNMFVQINASATSTILRCLLIYDLQANGANPAAADVLVAGQPQTMAPIVIGNGKRFHVLFDHRVVLSAQGDEIVRYKKYIKMKRHVKFNTGTAGTVADIQTGAMFLYFVSSEATNTPTVTYSIRTRFVDN